MNQIKILKYKIGLLALLIFTVVLLSIIIIQANATKQDSDAFNKASSIASNLNSYISNNNMIPSSLSDAGINYVPNNISYQKKSDTLYKFCVAYKASSSGFDPAAVETNLIGNFNGMNANNFDSSTANSVLIINSIHNKGENCQNVSPYFYSPLPLQ